MGLADKINSLMLDLGKFAYEHWMTYIMVILCVVMGGVLSALWGWPFAVFVPLFILWIGLAARNQYKRKLIK
jgi:hypothetical protein